MCYFHLVRFFRVFMAASAACWWASRLEYPEPEPTTVPLIADALAGQRLPVDCYSAWAESRQIRTKRIKLLLIGEKELYEKFYPFVNVHGF